jgi:hypothetical protein
MSIRALPWQPPLEKGRRGASAGKVDAASEEFWRGWNGSCACAQLHVSE